VGKGTHHLIHFLRGERAEEKEAFADDARMIERASPPDGVKTL
jgi:hypothetical protein